MAEIGCYVRNEQGQIQPGHSVVDSEALGNFAFKQAYNIVITQLLLNDRKDAFKNMVDQYKGCPGIDIESYVKAGVEQAIHDFDKCKSLVNQQNITNVITEGGDAEGSKNLS